MDHLNVALGLLRIVVGPTMAAHGYNKFFGGGRIPGTARWFDSMGMRPGRFHALLAASMEMGSGILFALGLLTPFAAAGIVGLMFVAAWTVHKENGFFIVKSGFEYNLVIATVAVAVATAGPGEWALDHALNIDDNLDGTVGFVISAIVGLAGAVALLATFFRPPAKLEA
jgi:putative oxidoreductase